VHTRPIAITAGDPAGIGPEIILRAARSIASRPVAAQVAMIVYGSVEVMKDSAAREGLDVEILQSDLPSVWPKLSVVSVGEPAGPIAIGQIAAEAGEIAYNAIAVAVRDAMAGRLRAIVTAPISKEALNLAGHPYAGHTELLADLSDSKGTCMLLAHDKLRVAHVSTHTALANASALLTPERLGRVLDLTFDALRSLGIARPRIAVAALNPHAGEGGLFGREDIDVTGPVVADYRARELDVSGPISGDIVFVRALAGEFDAVIAMYHDQGHIPIKLLGFSIDPATGAWLSLSGVNVTMGLPFIRTSVDHGTAFDIAGKGVASAQSLIEAIDFAVRLSDAGPQGTLPAGEPAR